MDAAERRADRRARARRRADRGRRGHLDLRGRPRHFPSRWPPAADARTRRPGCRPPSLRSIAEGLRYSVWRPELLGTYLVDMNAMFFGMCSRCTPHRHGVRRCRGARAHVRRAHRRLDSHRPVQRLDPARAPPRPAVALAAAAGASRSSASGSPASSGSRCSCLAVAGGMDAITGLFRARSGTRRSRTVYAGGSPGSR